VRGASALDEVLAKFPEAPLKVVVVWEPVVRTDIAPPFKSALARIDDPRVSQFWDPDLALSRDIVRAVNDGPARYGFAEALPEEFIVWDVVAVFGEVDRWSDDLPVPVYYGGPVYSVTDELQEALGAALARAGFTGH